MIQPHTKRLLLDLTPSICKHTTNNDNHKELLPKTNKNRDGYTDLYNYLTSSNDDRNNEHNYE